MIIKNKIIIILVATIFASLAGMAQGIEFLQSNNYEEALVKAKERNVPVFIDWYADWCVPCKMMEKDVYVNESVGTYYNKHFVSVKLNTEAKENLDLVKKFGITSMPTLMFVDGDGEVLSRVSGSMSIDDFSKLGKTVAGDLKSFEQIYDEYQKDPDNDNVTGELLGAASAFVTIQTGMEKKKWIIRVEKIFNKYVEKKLTGGDAFINANDYRLVKRFHQPKAQNDPVIEFMVKNMDKYIKTVGPGVAYYVIQYNTTQAEALAKSGNRKYTDNLERIKGDMSPAYNIVEDHQVSQYDIARYNCDALYELYQEKDVNKYIAIKNEYFKLDGDKASPLAKAAAAQLMYSVAGNTPTKENNLAAKEWIVESLASNNINMPLMHRINITALLGDVNKRLGNIVEAEKAYNQAYAETLQLQQETTQKYLQAMLKKRIERLKLE